MMNTKWRKAINKASNVFNAIYGVGLVILLAMGLIAKFQTNPLIALIDFVIIAFLIMVAVYMAYIIARVEYDLKHINDKGRN